MKNILIVLLSLYFLTSCTKNYQTSQTPPPDFELTEEGKTLLGKNWSEVAVKVIEDTPSGEHKNDITNQINTTDLDDLMVFQKDGTYRFDEGERKMVEQNSQVYEKGYWQLKNNQLVLLVDGAETLYQIQRLSTDSLVLKLPVKGEDYHYLITYVAL